ncbi:O-antigen ligase family protein [Demequina soli]|uniref:O-antigen ligase family protein n=1 Tax=Demequina soli TaxID=1638987 RepID=UPI000780472F|nr:O-antigen ligase family protein [Demequina soli]
MTIASIALFVGAALWVVGLGLTKERGRLRDQPLEFWWVVAAFTSSGMGTLLSFNLFTYTLNGAVFLEAGPPAIIGLLMIALTFTEHRPRLGAGGIAMLGLFVLFGVHVVVGQSPLMPLISFALFLPAMFVPYRRYDFEALKSGLRIAISACLGVLSLFVLTQPGKMIGPCRLDKCSVWGLSLGETGSGNAVGMFLAGVGVLSILVTAGWWRSLLVAIGAWLLVDLTSSRSALYSFLAGVGIALAWALTTRLRSRGFLWAALAAASAVVVTLPLVITDPTKFTGRAQLWQYTWQILPSSPIAGFGPSFWVRGDGSDGIDRNYATHNLFTEMLISGGVLGLSLFVGAILGALAAQRSLATWAHVAATAAMVIITSMTEVTSAPGRLYLVPCFVVYLFVAANTRQGRVPEDDAPPEQDADEPVPDDEGSEPPLALTA